MGKVTTGFSTSLDGFIAGPGDDIQHLFKWYFGGDVEVAFPGGMIVKVSPASAEVTWERIETTGALITGRRQFDLTHGWGGRHPLDVPVFVLTHTIPEGWGPPFTFVTDGIESALKQARAVAGNKNVVIDGANVVQQFLKAGLIDEVGLDLVPVLLGDGVRFFDHLGTEPIHLERISVIEAPGVTHMTFRVIK